MQNQTEAGSELNVFNTLAKAGVVTLAIPNPRAEIHNGYIVQYGVRTRDKALVFHFYPPVKPSGGFQEWDPKLRMNDRLEAAIQKVFDVSRITAGYQTELSSYYVIGGGYGAVPDPLMLARKFLHTIDEFTGK